MSSDIESILERLDPTYRGQLRSEGLARSLIWVNGDLPIDAPSFRADLSGDLIRYAFAMLSTAIRVRQDGEAPDIQLRAFEAAAEAIESVVVNGDSSEQSGFLSSIAAAAYHLAHFNARAFILLNRELENLSPAERLFRELVLRRFDNAKALCRGVIAEYDQLISARLLEGDIELASSCALVLNYHRALAPLFAFFATGDIEHIFVCQERLQRGIVGASDWGFAELWWLYRLTLLMLDDFERQSYFRVLPNPPGPISQLRAAFIDHLAARKHSEVNLWPSQIGAAKRAFSNDDDLVVALPTSAGKSRIADLCMIPVLAVNRDVIYVTPLRALSAQVERDLRGLFGALGYTVSSLYDSSPMEAVGVANDQIRIATPEKLDFALRRDPDILQNVGLIVFDEGHLIGTNPREIRYEQLIDRILRVKAHLSIRFVCLSALLPAGEDIATFASWIRDGQDGTPIRSEWRPTRQIFGTIIWNRDHARLDLEVQSQRPFVEHLFEQLPPIGRSRKKSFPKDDRELVLGCAFRLAELGESVLLYSPLKASVKANAREVISLLKKGYLRAPRFDVAAHLSAEDRAVLNEWLGNEHPVTECLLAGIAIHHGDLPRPVLAISERLISRRAVQVIVASPSIAQGINVSASTVIFQHLRRFNPTTAKPDLIPIEEFRNVVGRAGRAFVDIGGQILYSTGLSSGAVKESRLDDWAEMLKRSSDRKLESGLFRLIVSLLDRLGSHSDSSVEFLTAHANVDITVQGADGDVAQFNADVDALDSALLSLVADEQISERDVAKYLDVVLKGTLLARTLVNHAQRTQDIVRGVVERRLQGIVRRFTPAQRKVAYLSGIQLRLATDFEDLVAEVRDAVLDLERELMASGSVTNIKLFIATTLRILEFETFQYIGARGQVNDRAVVLRQWLTSVGLSRMMEDDDHAIQFVEEGIRYGGVWGVEAVSAAIDRGHDRDAGTSLAALLSYGVSSGLAVELMRAGFESRTGASKVSAAIPSIFSPRPVRYQWMEKNIKVINGLLNSDERVVFDAFWQRHIAQSARTSDFLTDLSFVAVGALPSDPLAFVFPAGERDFEVTDRDLRVFGKGRLPIGAEIRRVGERFTLEGGKLLPHRAILF